MDRHQHKICNGRLAPVSKRLLLVTLATVFVLAEITRAWATTVYFVPGDAFFHAQLPPQQLVKLLRKGGNFQLHYSRPPGAPPPALCGFLGCPTIELQGVPRISNRVLTAIRDKVELAEGDSLSVLVYPASFELGKQRLFVKYNENWMGEKALPLTGMFGGTTPEGISTPEERMANFQKHLRYLIPYQPFVDSAAATAHDWKFAADFPALLPEGGPADWNTVGNLSKTVGNCQYEDCVLVICNVADARKLYNLSGPASLVELRGHSATLIKATDGDFEETSLSTPVAK